MVASHLFRHREGVVVSEVLQCVVEFESEEEQMQHTESSQALHLAGHALRWLGDMQSRRGESELVSDCWKIEEEEFD